MKNIALCLLLAGIGCKVATPESPPAKPQYQSEKITVPAAHAKEPERKDFSLELADDYLEKGAVAWTRKRGCVTCHTTGTYMQVRPALTSIMGEPTPEIHELLIDELAELKQAETAELRKSTKPAQVIYIAAGLAEPRRNMNTGIWCAVVP